MQRLLLAGLALSLCLALARADCASGLCSAKAASPKLLYSWRTIDYAWVSPAQRALYIANGMYIPENNALTGLKAYRDDIFVTISRWRPGVPSSLNKVVTVDGKHVLQPYPSWAWQEMDSPHSLQYVQSMEIDSRGWMWILDVGRRNILAHSDIIVNGPCPKLVIWDINKNCAVRTFVFPNHVLPWNNSFANDIAVDETNGFAYISNTADIGGIIVYDFNRNLARRFTHPTMSGVPTAQIPIHGKEYPIGFPTDGIALSHDTNTVYYAALSSTHRYSIPTDKLKDFTLSNEEIGKHVHDHGTATYTDGMAFTDDGRLIYGDFGNGAVYAWDVKKPLAQAQVLCSNDKLMQWPDTFAFDGKGNLLFTSNKLHKYVFGEMTFDGSDGDNWRIWSVPIGAGSYLTKKPVPASATCER